jgi:hypothetical protein
MKSFKEYITESARTFDYRIKIAGDLNTDVMDKFEKSLSKYEVEKLSKPKKTPVQKSPAGFPELANQEIHIMDAVFNYPATPQELTELWHQAGGDPNHIRIITRNFDDSVNQQNKEAEESPVLDKAFPGPTAEQKQAADSYANMGVLMNSALGAKFTVAGGKTARAETTNDLPVGKKSPIGGTNKIPTPKSSFR